MRKSVQTDFLNFAYSISVQNKNWTFVQIVMIRQTGRFDSKVDCLLCSKSLAPFSLRLSKLYIISTYTVHMSHATPDGAVLTRATLKKVFMHDRFTAPYSPCLEASALLPESVHWFMLARSRTSKRSQACRKEVEPDPKETEQPSQMESNNHALFSGLLVPQLESVDLRPSLAYLPPL